MANRQRIEVARVGEYWMRVAADTVTQERVLPANSSLAELHPEFVKQIGAYTIYSIDEPTSADSKRIADEIFAAIESEFASLPDDARKALEQAAISRGQDAWLQIEITNTGLIGSANTVAAEWASKHAGKSWPGISDTTRNRLREIIMIAFEKKTPFSEVISEIQNAGDFSDERAATIARTEISMAQVGSNLEAWKKTGLVKKIRWMAVGPNPCPICLENDGEVREIGQKFPSGHGAPLAHADCTCILSAVL